MTMSILRSKFGNLIYFSLSLGCPIRLCFQPKINFQSIDSEVNILIHKFIYEKELIILNY